MSVRSPPGGIGKIDARKRFHLSHAQVQMARELGMNPRRLGGKANHRQEPWKAPLPVFIEILYEKRFGKVRPDRVLSVEARVRELAVKKAAKRERRRARRLSVLDSPEAGQSPDRSTAADDEQLGVPAGIHPPDPQPQLETEVLT